jgi:hypothetical protein
MILQGFEPQDRTACCVLVAVTQNSCVPPLSAAEQRAMLRVAVAVGCLRRCNGRGGASDCRARRRRWAPPPGVGFKEARLARVLQLALWEDAAAAAAATAAAVVDADRCWLTPTLPQLRLPPPRGGHAWCSICAAAGRPALASSLCPRCWQRCRQRLDALALAYWCARHRAGAAAASQHTGWCADTRAATARGALRTLEKRGVVHLSSATAGAAGAAAEPGCSLVEPSLLSRCREAVATDLRALYARLGALGLSPTMPFRFSEACRRGPGRIDLRFSEPWAPGEGPGEGGRLHALLPLLEGHGAWWPLVRRALGPGCRLLFAGAVVAEPGALAQAWHADGGHLPGREAQQQKQQQQQQQQCHLPPHCLNVFVPLVDMLSADVGPTEFLPGSHTVCGALAALRSAGGALVGTQAGATCFCGDAAGRGVTIFDYRVLHRGTANRTADVTRPVLYLTYAAPWFSDERNFPSNSLFAEGHGAGCPCLTCATQHAATPV